MANKNAPFKIEKDKEKHFVVSSKKELRRVFRAVFIVWKTYRAPSFLVKKILSNLYDLLFYLRKRL